MEILDKVKRLLALAQSDNVNEAAIAARQAQKLMDRHGIETAMLEVEADAPAEGIVDQTMTHLAGKQLATWKNQLASAVSEANGCQAYSSRDGDSVKLGIVGRRSDAEKARYLTALLMREIDRLAKVEGRRFKAQSFDGRGPGRTYLNSFRLGAVREINRRLQEARRETEAEMREMAAAQDRVQGTSTALVRVNGGIVRYGDRFNEAAAWGEQHLRLGAARRSKARYDAQGYAQGERAGRSVDLGAGRGALGRGARGNLN